MSMTNKLIVVFCFDVAILADSPANRQNLFVPHMPNKVSLTIHRFTISSKIKNKSSNVLLNKLKCVLKFGVKSCDKIKAATMNYGGPRLYTIVNVQNISRDMTNERIREIFGKYGGISSLKVMNENEEAWPRFAYVAFEDSDAADEAVIELNGQIFDDDRIRVRRTIKKESGTSKPSWSREYVAKDQSVGDSSASSSSNRLKRCRNEFSIFVKNLDCSVSSIQLSEAFAPYGHVMWPKVISDSGGISKGYGFVTFGTEEEAKKAIAGMNGRLIGPKIVAVEMSYGRDQNNHRFSPWSTSRYPKAVPWRIPRDYPRRHNRINESWATRAKRRRNEDRTPGFKQPSILEIFGPRPSSPKEEGEISDPLQSD